MCPIRFMFLCIMLRLRGLVGMFVEPTKPDTLYEGDVLDIKVRANDTDFIDSEMIQIKIQLKEDWLVNRAILLNTSLNLTNKEPEKNFSVMGVFSGYAWASIQYCDKEKCVDDDYKDLEQPVEFIIIRRQRAVDTVFTVLVVALVITANLGMGCSVDLTVVRDVLKRPIAPLIGFLCQFLIMPPVAFMLGRVFRLSVAEQLGILAVGSSPGGGASNMWTVLFDGDVNLSITMTLVSTLAALGMFPLYMFTLGKVIMDEATFVIPYKNLITSLIGILVPILIGILIHRKLPNFAEKVVKITKPMIFIFLVFIFTFGVWVNWYMFKLFHISLIIVSCLLPWIGFIGGGFVAWVCRQPKPRIIAICIETGVQNVGVAIFALRLSLPQPLNDLSIVASVCPSSFTAAPLLAFLIGNMIYQRCCRANVVIEKDDQIKPAGFIQVDTDDVHANGDAVENGTVANGGTVENGTVANDSTVENGTVANDSTVENGTVANGIV